MDVLVTREAAGDLKLINALAPRPSAWGLVLGHKRGHRWIVERLFPAGGAEVPPSPEILAKVDSQRPGRLIGVYAVRPAGPFRKAVLGPWFYGKLVLDVRPSRGGPALRPHVVEFDGRFFFAPVSLAAPKEGARE